MITEVETGTGGVHRSWIPCMMLFLGFGLVTACSSTDQTEVSSHPRSTSQALAETPDPALLADPAPADPTPVASPAPDDPTATTGGGGGGGGLPATWACCGQPLPRGGCGGSTQTIFIPAGPVDGGSPILCAIQPACIKCFDRCGNCP